MIKRDYFMSARKNHDDGKGSFSFMYSYVTRTSWLPQSISVFEECRNDISKKLKDRPGGDLEVISFSRV